MSFIKHANSKILSTTERFESLREHLGPQRIASFQSRIAATDPTLLDSERFFYVRSRAVSDGEFWGPNDNGDYFNAHELTSRHGTFVYCPRYIDHNNTEAANAVGIVVASVHHPGPQPGGWVEIIAAVDRERAAQFRISHLPGQPDLLTAIKTGQITDTSMGCFVEYSLCSICANKAADISEYCPHIAKFKGLEVQTADGKKLAYEDNRGVTFFEDSFITTRIAQGGGGADLNAKILSEVVAAQHKAWPEGQPHWSELIVNRLEPLMARESEMKDKKKSVAVNGPDATSVETTVMDDKRVTQVDTGGYDGVGKIDDKDEALFSQSEGASEQSSKPVVIDNPEEKLSQQSGEVDYPHPPAAGNVPEPPEAPGNLDAVAKKEAQGEGMTADPANLVGGKPDEVLEAEQTIEEDAAEEVAGEKNDTGAEETEVAMDERHGREQDKTDIAEDKEAAGNFTIGQLFRRSVGKLLGLKVADVQDGEGIRLCQDYIRQSQGDIKRLQAERDANVSKTFKTACNRRINRLQVGINRAVGKAGKAAVDTKYAAHLNKQAEQFGGNPQQLVDFQDVYETAGDPDKNLYDQSTNKSPTEPPVAVGRGENVSEEEKADDHAPLEFGEVLSMLKGGKWTRTRKGHVFTAGRVRLAEGNAGKMLDRIESLMDAPNAMSYDQAETKVMEEMAKRIASRKRSKPAQATRPRKPGPTISGRRRDSLRKRLRASEQGGKRPMRTRAMDEEEFMSDDEIDMPLEAGRQRVARPDPYNGEDPRGASDVDAEGKMESGNADTLASPATKGVSNPGEFVRSTDGPGHRSPQPTEGRQRRRRGHRPVRAMEDPEGRMDDGNMSTLESPSTGDVMDEANETGDRKSAMDTQHTSIEQRDHVLSTRDVLLHRSQAKVARLEAVQRKQAVENRKRQAGQLVRAQTEKGMFAHAGNGVRQKVAAEKEFRRLCKLSPAEFAEAARQVKAARKGTRVAEWTRRVPIEAREGAVRLPVNQRSASRGADADTLTTMFD